MTLDVRVLPDDIHISAQKGELVSTVLRRGGIDITYPCGGKGTCGHCMVIANGVLVKACGTVLDEDTEILIPAKVRAKGQEILTDIHLYGDTKGELPLVEQIELCIDEPTLDDSMSDCSRLIATLAEKTGIVSENIRVELSCMRTLPRSLRETGFRISVNAIYENGGLTVLSVGNGALYGVAIDVGTTTVVTALCDLKTGNVIDMVGSANPQAGFGADVISRIIYAEENENSAAELQDVILKTISDSICSLAERVGILPESIPVAVIAANTVMAHLLLGLPCDYLRREPYVPAASVYPAIRAYELGLPILPVGRVIVLPAVSSYVGGDITAGVIATKLHKLDGLNMLIDIGTNGEIVLAGEGFMLACSSSAGPAFEGSGISCGSRAIPGAIDNVSLQDGQLVFDVIGNGEVEPATLCGSGLISLLSALFEKGVINRSGRFVEGKEYALTDKITVLESDILNLIRAKGAIFAGTRVLVNRMELSFGDLSHIFISGGFGRTLDVSSAVKIGMLPPIGIDAYSYEGNSSLAGALMVLNDRTIDAGEIAASIMNLELSVGNEFMEEFTKACFLPHTELSFD